MAITLFFQLFSSYYDYSDTWLSDSNMCLALGNGSRKHPILTNSIYFFYSKPKKLCRDSLSSFSWNPSNHNSLFSPDVLAFKHQQFNGMAITLFFQLFSSYYHNLTYIFSHFSLIINIWRQLNGMAITFFDHFSLNINVYWQLNGMEMTVWERIWNRL